MTQTEVLRLALEALELVSIEFVCNGAHHAKKDRHEWLDPCPIVDRYKEAITAIKQARALDKKAENARELGLDYEPVKKQRWAVFCRVCKKEWSVSYQHPGKSICADCDDAPLAQLADHSEQDLDMVKAQPAPVQEPVAWCVYCDGQFNLNIFRVKDVADVKKVRLDLEYPNHKRKVVPLYTTPPQRKPLTDEQIADIVIEMNGNEPTALFWRDLARAIEAAHGIKGEA